MSTTENSTRNPAADEQPSHLRRNVLVGMSTLSAVVLAMGYHTSLDAQGAGSATASASTSVAGTSPAVGSAAGGGTAAGSTSSSTGGTSAGAGTSAAAGASGAAGGAATTLRDGTYTGTSSSTRWGPVQVRIVVSGGKITSSQAVTYPTANNKDVQINSRAVPTYNSEAVQAQSADIDAISGATVTWQGYTASLQSAIDQARA